VKRTPGDEEAVCVRLFQIFSSCPVLASVFLFLLSSTSVTFCSFFFPVLQMLYVKKMKAKTERDDELVRLVVLLRLLFGMDVLPSVFSCSFFVFLLAAALPNTCFWSAGKTGFLQSSLSALAFCSLASLFCFRFSSLPLLRSVFLSHSNERMKEKNSLCSRVAGREGGLLLIRLLRLRQGAASAGSDTEAEEGYGCGGGYSWASGLPWFSTGGAVSCSSSWCGCWAEGDDELTMALRLLVGPSVVSSVYLLSFCSSLLYSSSSIWSLVFFPVLPVLALLRRKWLLLLWSSGKAGLKRSCWIVGENLVVLGGSRRCLTVVRKVAVCFQTVEGESRERGYRSSLPLCFPPLTAIPVVQNFPPLFSFPALSPLFKNSSPPFKNSPPPFAAASKGSGAATCAWGAGDTKLGQPALLPCLRCSPLLRVSGSGMHMGGTVSTLFWFFSFFSFYFFIFVGIQKWVTTSMYSRHAQDDVSLM